MGWKWGLNTKIHLARSKKSYQKIQFRNDFFEQDAHGRVVRVIVTEGTTADCSKGLELIEGLDILGLLADIRI